jgi:uncharacterized protein YggE
MSVRKTSVFVGLGVLALAAAVVLSSGVLPVNAAPAGQAATPAAAGQVVPRTITVVGRGEVKVKPDVAHTTVGVEALGETVDAAMADAEARMTSVLAALKGMGIADKDIQTSNFSVNFERQMEPKPATAQATPGTFEPPAGFYRVSNMVQVTIRDMATVGDVIDTAVKAGANNVWGINFGLENTAALESQAREAAVKDAKARADSLAGLNSVQVGDVIAISEVIGNQPMPMYSVAEARGMGGGGTSAEPGEVTFTTQVQVVYGIK